MEDLRLDVENGFETIMLTKDYLKPVLVNVKTPSSAEGLLYAYIEVTSGGDSSKSTEVRMDVDTDYDFGNLTKIGDTVDVHYAGILASNAKLFDSSMEYVWDNYHRKPGSLIVIDILITLKLEILDVLTRETLLIIAKEVEGMIEGFDNKMIEMYEGQTLAVRIPASQAYGEAGCSSDLAGEDLIFIIEMVNIN